MIRTTDGKRRILHQFTPAALAGDATTDHALTIRRWLRQMGYTSEVYAEHCQPEMEKEIRPLASYRPRSEEQYLIYHHAIGSDTVERLLAVGLPIILIYHNITPPEYYAAVDPAWKKGFSRTAISSG